MVRVAISIAVFVVIAALLALMMCGTRPQTSPEAPEEGVAGADEPDHG